MYTATKLDDSQLFSLKALIAQVKEHEERTVVLLGEVLPLTLNHIWGNENVTMVNELIAVLSPTNRKASILFFNAMQPHEYTSDKKDKRKKLYGKRINRQHTLETKGNMERFFSLDPETDVVNPEGGYFGGDYWLWEGHNVEMKDNDTDWLEYAKKAVENASKKMGLETDELIGLIIQAEGISTQNMLSVLAPKPVEDKEVA